MEKYHISDYWNKGIKGHFNYDFVDIVVNDDNLLFIDPILLTSADDEWSQEAGRVVKSFFDTFYEIYRNEDKEKKFELLSHAREQNGTRLGYGCGNNGRGNTAQGLLEIFSPLEYLLKEILTVNKAEDLPVLLPNFADDGLSDLLTNILHEQLNKFTLLQLNKYGIKEKHVVKNYSVKNVEYLIQRGCKIIVIACNTATSIAIQELREKYPNICFIGTEPAIKPAVNTEHRKVLVMATSLTLQEEKLQHLIVKLDAKNDLELLPMDKLVICAEKYENIDFEQADSYIKEQFQNLSFQDISSIVLGCTHFPIFKKEFARYIPKETKIIDSAKGVVNNMIQKALQMEEDQQKIQIEIVTTKNDPTFSMKVNQILKKKTNEVNYTYIQNISF